MVFNSVDIGTIRSARGAGGFSVDEAKKVASTVAMLFRSEFGIFREQRLRASDRGLLTCVLSVQARLEQIIELENESPTVLKERKEARHIPTKTKYQVLQPPDITLYETYSLAIRPDDSIPRGRLRSRRAPDCVV